MTLINLQKVDKPQKTNQSIIPKMVRVLILQTIYPLSIFKKFSFLSNCAPYYYYYLEEVFKLLPVSRNLDLC